MPEFGFDFIDYHFEVLEFTLLTQSIKSLK
jgi:hypothetical protein